MEYTLYYFALSCDARGGTYFCTNRHLIDLPVTLDIPSAVGLNFALGQEPIKHLKHKFYATLFLSILIGLKIWVANQNVWKIA